MTTKKNLSSSKLSSSESLLKDIRRNTKRIFTSEQKVLIIMEGIRGEQSIAELCRKYGISDSTYYKWNKDFIEAGKARLDGDIVREATSDEVKELRNENLRLKEALADLVVRYDVAKKLETHRISPMHEFYTRYSTEEKETIVLTVKRSELSISGALKHLRIPRRTFYNWYKRLERMEHHFILAADEFHHKKKSLMRYGRLILPILISRDGADIISPQ